jgi:hypothetical protein
LVAAAVLALVALILSSWFAKSLRTFLASYPAIPYVFARLW